MEDYKQETKRLYDRYAHEYEERKKEYLPKYLLPDINRFIGYLKGKRILDLGSGGGRDAVYFKEKGLNPVCIDLSPVMVKLCKEKGLEAYEMDFERLDFDDHSFDGVWAHTSLLHVPKKNIDAILHKIRDLLKKGGIFLIGMKEGTFEGYPDDPCYPGTKRYFAFYTEQDLKEKLSKWFTLLHVSKIATEKNSIFLNIFCKPKE